MKLLSFVPQFLIYGILLVWYFFPQSYKSKYNIRKYGAKYEDLMKNIISKKGINGSEDGDDTSQFDIKNRVNDGLLPTWFFQVITFLTSLTFLRFLTVGKEEEIFSYLSYLPIGEDLVKSLITFFIYPFSAEGGLFSLIYWVYTVGLSVSFLVLGAFFLVSVSGGKEGETKKEINQRTTLGLASGFGAMGVLILLIPVYFSEIISQLIGFDIILGGFFESKYGLILVSSVFILGIFILVSSVIRNIDVSYSGYQLKFNESTYIEINSENDSIRYVTPQINDKSINSNLYTFASIIIDKNDDRRLQLFDPS